MSSNIDERIVSMKFENDQFQKGVAETTGSMDSLKKSLSMEGIGSSLENISSKFSAFGAIGFTALQHLTDSAIGMGQKIAGAILDPLIEGGKKRSLNIEQAKFQFKGLGMDVEQSMADALYAVKNTAFGLDEAAVAAGQFGASGIKSGTEMQTALRGIAGVAAMAGTSYSDMANVFTKVAGQGRLMGDDLNRLGVHGINAASVLAKAMGTTEENVRDMVTKGKISFQEFSTAMSDAFGEHATEANQTYSGSLANLRAAFARIGATSFTPYFERQRDLFNAISPKVDDFAAALKPVQLAWADIQKAGNDGLIKFINGLDFTNLKTAAPLFADILKIGYNLINMVLKPIGDAFREIFPPVEHTGNVFESFATAVLKILTAIKPTGLQLLYLKQTFAGFFAILSIGWEILKQVGSLFGRLFDTIFSGTDKSSNGFLHFTARIGVFLTEANNAIKSGEGLGKAFQFIGDMIVKPIELIKAFFGALSNDKGPVDFRNFWEKVADIFRTIARFFQPVVDFVQTAFGKVKEGIQNVIDGMNFNSVVGLLGVGLLGALSGMIYNFIFLIKNGLPAAIGRNFLGPIRTGFSNLSITLQGMQAKLKAETLFKIAEAIALMALAVLALAFIPPDKLGNALVAIALLMGGMIKFMEAMDLMLKMTTLKDSVKMSLIVGSLLALAGAMLIMAAAVAIFAALPFLKLLQGVGAIIVLLAAIAGFSWIIGNGKKLALVSVTMGLMAVGIAALAGATAILAAIPLMGLIQGVGAIVVLLAAIAGFSQILGKDPTKLVMAAISLALIGGAMTALAGAVALFAKMSLEDIGKGLIAMGGALLIIAIAMAALPASVIVSSFALLMVATALSAIVGVMKSMAKMSWEDIGKSMVVLAGSLLILGLAMAAMGNPVVLIGAAALIIAAGAMMVLAPALKLLGSMSWDDIGRGLTILAAAIGILAIGGILLIPAIPAFLAIGLAALLIGSGAMMAGTGLLMMAAGFIAFAAAVAIGAEGIKIAALVIISIIPELMSAFAQGLIDFALVIAGGATEFTAAMVTLITSMINAVATVGPLLINTIWDLIVLLVSKIVEGVPLFVEAAWSILLAFLTGLRNHLPELITVAGDIIAEFITGLGNNAYKIATAGGDAVLKFINGMGDYVRDNSGKFITAGSKLFRAVVDGISAAIENGGYLLRYAGERIGNAVIQGAMNALKINSPSKVFRDKIMGAVFEGIEAGNDRNINRAVAAGDSIGSAMVDATSKALAGVGDAVDTNLTLNPTITPILDLTNIQNGSSSIAGLLTPPTLKVDDSYAIASSIATAQRTAAEDAALAASTDPSVATQTNYNFTQNNTSPKALSPAELYRQGKNLLSVVKKEQPANA